MSINKEQANLICEHLGKLGWYMSNLDREKDIATLLRTYDKDLELWLYNLGWTEVNVDSVLKFKKALFNVDLEKIIKDNK